MSRGSSVPLLIAGAGPAGLAAFIQARRHGVTPLVVDPADPGGALRGGRRVENYPGMPSCPGREAARRMTLQAVEAGLEVVRDRVEALYADGPWLAVLSSGRAIQAGAVILATGQSPVVPEVLAPLVESGALLLPGAFEPEGLRGRRILVVGGGDVAFDQALLLLDHGASPRIVCRSAPRALPALQGEAEARGIPVRAGRVPIGVEEGPPCRVAFAGAGGVTDGEALEADGVLVAAGRCPEPPAALGPSGAALRLAAYRHGDGLPAGLFMAGDVWRGPVRQAVVACGDGCAAAVAACGHVAGAGGRPWT